MKSVQIGDVAAIVSGATPKTSVASNWDGDVPWATPADLSKLDGAYISDTPRKLTQVGVRSCATTILPTHSVLLSSRAPIGHVAINAVPMATNQGFKSLIPGPELDAKFLYHWLKSNTAYLQSLGNGATFKELSKAVTSQIQIPLPPLDEQRRIAAILDDADTLRTKARRVLSHLDTLSQSIFDAMFGDPMRNERGLPVQDLSDWIEPDRPITYGILKPGLHVESGVPYVRVADMKDGGIAIAGVRRTSCEIGYAYRRSTLRAGDLLMSIRGHVGRFAMVPEELEGANITQDTARLAVANGAAQYVRVAMESRSMQEWMARRTIGAAVKGINLGSLRHAPLPRPPLADMTEFARRVEAVNAQRATVTCALTAEDELVASLRAGAFRGEL